MNEGILEPKLKFVYAFPITVCRHEEMVELGKLSSFEDEDLKERK